MDSKGMNEQDTAQQISTVIDKVFSALGSTLGGRTANQEETRMFFPSGIELIDLSVTIGPKEKPLASFSFTVAGKEAPAHPKPPAFYSQASPTFSISSIGPGNISLPRTDADFIAGIVYGETSTTRAPSSMTEMAEARKWIAEIAYRRDYQKYQGFPNGVAQSQRPNDKILSDPNSNYTLRWRACQEAQNMGWQSFTQKNAAHKDTDVRHFFMWPSNDGKTPRAKVATDPSAEDWPFNNDDAIIHAFGPFIVDSPGSTPAGSDIYIFIYQGIA